MKICLFKIVFYLEYSLGKRLHISVLPSIKNITNKQTKNDNNTHKTTHKNDKSTHLLEFEHLCPLHILFQINVCLVVFYLT